MSTRVYYNGVTIENVMTREFDSETIYDPTGTDVIGRKVRFTFTGTLHSQNVANAVTYVDFEQQGQASSVPTKAIWFQELLSVARKTLVVSINGTEFFRCIEATSANGNSPFVDRDNGPKPTSAKVTHIANDKIFRVSFSITCHLSNCAYMSGAGIVQTPANPVVNNRWSVKEAMDDSYFITRTISGHVRFSSSLTTPHAYKNLCVPPLERGFARKSLDFEEKPNGLEATYTITDKQVHTSAPYPLTKFEARHEESTNDSLSFTSSMQVSVWGDRSASKADLLVRAVQIADARLHFTNGVRNNFVYGNLAIIDQIGEENRLELHVTLIRYEEEQRTVFDLMAREVGTPLSLPSLPNANTAEGRKPYSPNVSRSPAVWGYDDKGVRNPVQSFLLHCYLQDPCSPEKGIWQGDGGSSEPDDSKPPEETSIAGSVVSNLTPSPPTDQYSQEHSQAIYTLCRLTSRYSTTVLKAHMPLAFRSSSANPNAATSATVGLSAGLCRRIIRVDCERVGEQPYVPKPKERYAEHGNGGTLLQWWIESNAPTLAPAGDKRVYRLTAYYVYAMDRAPRDTDKLAVGVLPFTNFTRADAELDLRKALSEKVGP